MDIITTPPYEEMQKIYNKYFSLNFLGNSISNKFALISLTCYLTYKLKAKKPEDLLKGLAVICSDFAYGCTEFLTFGIEDKKIPEKIKELLDSWIPF